MDAIDRAAALLTEQHGVAHVAQLRRAGLPDARVRARLRSGSWQEVRPNVVAVRGGAETARRRVWEAYVAAGTADDGTERPVAVGGLAAAFLHGMVADPPPVVEVLVARGIACPRPPGMAVREVRTWRTRAFVRRDGLLVTALPDTLVDVARLMDDATYLTLVQDQCFGRPGLLARVVGLCRRGLAGSARARRVATQLARGLDSPLHVRAVGVLRGAGLAPSRCDAEVVPGIGPSDCLYLAGNVPVLALEFDGDVHRVSRAAFLHDRAKDLALREVGCATLRFTFEQVARPERFLADVRRALATAELTVSARTNGAA